MIALTLLILAACTALDLGVGGLIAVIRGAG